MIIEKRKQDLVVVDENEEVLIKLERVTKSYGRGKPAAENVSFEVKAGTIHGFIGPNGAGKSTILNAIARLHLMDSGTILVDGRNILVDPRFNERMGFIGPDSDFASSWTVKSYLLRFAQLRDIDENKILRWLDNSSLAPFKDKLCRNLSSGWQKITKILALSLYKPKILVLDEITNGLDPTNHDMLFNQLKIWKSEGAAILMSTHILSDLQEIADHITMIKQGKIVYTGPKTKNIRETYQVLYNDENNKQEKKDMFFFQDQ